ncbi:MAG: phosphatase PAP2 family protein [Candidatus Delongbacteria bacterium]|nr:phosphatase PAP2 family protein [Candidatus Delongbacteria bacterium]
MTTFSPINRNDFLQNGRDDNPVRCIQPLNQPTKWKTLNAMPINFLDRLTLIYNVLLLIIIALRSSRIQYAELLFIFHSAVILLALGIIKFDSLYRRNWSGHLHAWYSLVFLYPYYLETIYFKYSYLPFELDPYLAAFENFLFNSQPSIWLADQFPALWIKELMSFFYLGHFYLGVIVAIYLYRKRHQYFLEFASTVVLTFAFCYLFFIFFPSSGPQFYFNNSIFKPEIGIFYYVLSYIELNIEIPSGAFPSSHVAVEGLVILYTQKYIKSRWRYVILFLSFGLIMSTVYIRAHYVIDVMAGLAVCSVFYHLMQYYDPYHV